jgi:hypothetical protein
VSDSGVSAQFALWGRISGSPGKIEEIEIVVARANGEVVFSERSGPSEFVQSKVKPENPMTACVFLVSRLNGIWNLDDPSRSEAPRGAMAERMARRSGLPPERELADMKPRLKTLVESESPKLTIYPVHLWPGTSVQSAQQLCRMINESGQFRAVVNDKDPALNVKGDPNQQKVLWDTARAFRAFLKDHPAETPYALLADFGLNAASGRDREASHVHLILCQGNGQWVWVDYQNSHHDDFQSITPTDVDACTRLALKRIRSVFDHQRPKLN